jgi:hypothetical protein
LQIPKRPVSEPGTTAASSTQLPVAAQITELRAEQALIRQQMNLLEGQSSFQAGAPSNPAQ